MTQPAILQPATETFVHIEPGTFTPEDITDLERALARDYSGTDMEALAKMILGGMVTCWRFQGPESHGVFGTQICLYPKGSELYVWLIAGKGMIPHMPYIWDCIETIGKTNGCNRIRGLARKGMARILTRGCGMTQHSICLIKEIA